MDNPFLSLAPAPDSNPFMALGKKLDNPFLLLGKTLHDRAPLASAAPAQEGGVTGVMSYLRDISSDPKRSMAARIPAAIGGELGNIGKGIAEVPAQVEAVAKPHPMRMEFSDPITEQRYYAAHPDEKPPDLFNIGLGMALLGPGLGMKTKVAGPSAAEVEGSRAVADALTDKSPMQAKPFGITPAEKPPIVDNKPPEVANPAPTAGAAAAPKPVAEQLDGTTLPTREKLQGIVDEYRNRFGIKLPIPVTHETIDPGTGGRARSERIKATKEPLNYAISINPGLSPTRQAAALTHEFGHILQINTFDRLPMADQKAVMDAFKRDMAGNKVTRGNSDVNARFSMEQRGPVLRDIAEDSERMMKEAGIKPAGKESLQQALLDTSFSEWFANQTSKFLTSNKQAIGIVEKFFKGVADQWRRLYQEFTGHAGTVPEMEAFLRKHGHFFDEEPLAAKPQSASAATSPLEDVLAANIRDLEKNAAAEPGMVDHLKAAGRLVRSAFAPETMRSTGGDRAAATLREEMGKAGRDSAQTAAALDKFQRQTAGMSMGDKLDVTDYLQNYSDKASQGYTPAPEVAPLFNAIRKTFTDRRAKLEAAPSTAKMSFIDDYFPQNWKNPPEQTRAFINNWIWKEGNKSALNKRSIPSIADGVRAGLVPRDIDPIGATLRYVDNIDRFLGTNAALEKAETAGDLVWRNPRDAPPGWVEVKTSRRKGDQKPYAPEGWAAVYNAFVSREPEGFVGGVLQAARRSANMLSAFRFALSAYHAVNIAGEAQVGGLANAIMEAKGGSLSGAVKALAATPTKPITSALRGAQMQRAYLTAHGSPEMNRVVDLATRANFRVAGKGRVYDEYRFSQGRNLVESFRKGSLKLEAAAALQDIKKNPMMGSLRTFANVAGRTMETLTDPLFKFYIPMAKNGAYYDMLSTWLRQHPGATDAEQVAAARKTADTIDDRFGEMNQDNIFWQKWMKQVAQASVVSYSYEMGTLRMALGAAKDTALALPRAGAKALGKAAGDVVTDRMIYALALPVVVGVNGAIYQYLKTGKPPDSLKDLFHPQTGGTDASSKQPERAVLPSYASQFLNAGQEPGQEMANKLNGNYELLKGAVTGTDWRGDPIAASTDTWGQWAGKWADFALGEYKPISLGQQAKGGTNISAGERLLGLKPAPMYATDPKGYQKMKEKRALEADAQKAFHDENAERARQGKAPLTGRQAADFFKNYTRKETKPYKQLHPYGGAYP